MSSEIVNTSSTVQMDGTWDNSLSSIVVIRRSRLGYRLSHVPDRHWTSPNKVQRVPKIPYQTCTEGMRRCSYWVILSSILLST